jgi:hypothetical protein
LATAAAARSLAEASLFNFAYASGTAVSLSSSWGRSFFWLGRGRRAVPQFPRRTYNHELVAYYQLALSSESLLLTYLALYKVLEYFFTSASEQALHELLQGKLVAPDFNHSKPRKLREMVSLVRRFDQKMDEGRMLTTVLKRYFEPEELRNWIADREAEGNAPYFTASNTVLGLEQRVDTSAASIHASIAKRLYAIRNALVHHKEGEDSKFIPFSGQEEELYMEAPLIMFLAEQLIIKAGDDLKW